MPCIILELKRHVAHIKIKKIYICLYISIIKEENGLQKILLIAILTAHTYTLVLNLKD